MKFLAFFAVLLFLCEVHLSNSLSFERFLNANCNARRTSKREVGGDTKKSDTIVVRSSSFHQRDRKALLPNACLKVIGMITATAISFPQLTYAVEATASDRVQQGMKLFRSGDVKGSVGAFDQAINQNRNLAAIMWQRGLSLYYAEQFVEGSKQFRNDIAANPSDVEEIIWTIMCESKTNGFPTAIKDMPLLPKKDRRPIMRVVYDMFRGETNEKALADLGDKSGKQNSGGDYYYSRLYLSLYREAQGDAEASKQFMKDAVTSYYGQASTDYMTSVAKVHLASR